MFDLYQNPTPENAQELAESRKDLLRSKGASSEELAAVDNFLTAFNTNPEQVRNRIGGQLAARYSTEWKAMREATTGVSAEVKIGAQEILEDGTIIQSTPKGPVVWSPEGKRVKGRAAADAVQVARAAKVTNLRKAAGGKRLAALEAERELKPQVEAGVISAKEAAKISVKAFDRLEKIRSNINNLSEGIALLEEGAETGPVISKLPSIRAASVKLDNLQGRLGLDVLHSTTFGALSAAELRFALSTALPKGLEGPKLKEWLINKRDSQEILADYLESAAIFLGVPGNTVRGWILKKKSESTDKDPWGIL